MTLTFNSNAPPNSKQHVAHINTYNIHESLSAMESFESSALESSTSNAYDNPRTWTPRKRILSSLPPIIGAFVICTGSAIYVPSIPGIITEYNLSLTLGLSPISLWSLGLSVGPIITAAASELFGRRIIFHVSLPLCLVFTLVGGFAQNFATIAVARFLSGLAGSPCLTVAVGILNDIWDVEQERTGTMLVAVFAASMIWATEISPVIGAAVVREGGWRWTFWLMVILLGIALLAFIPMPETFKPVLERKNKKKLGLEVQKRKSTKKLLSIACGRPLEMLLVEGIVWPTALVAGIIQAIVFAFYVAYAVVFERLYGFSDYEAGLCFLPLFVGSILGFIIVAVFDKKKYQPEKAAAALEQRPVRPEARLYPAMVGSVLLPISLFWLAWTARPSIHWAVPCTSGLVFGIAYLTTMLALPVYKNDVYGTEYGASALAADNIVRYLFSAASPLFMEPMMNRLGIDWAISLLGCISVVLLPVPWIIFRYGPALRAKSLYVKIAADTI